MKRPTSRDQIKLTSECPHNRNFDHDTAVTLRQQPSLEDHAIIQLVLGNDRRLLDLAFVG